MTVKTLKGQTTSKKILHEGLKRKHFFDTEKVCASKSMRTFNFLNENDTKVQIYMIDAHTYVS